MLKGRRWPERGGTVACSLVLVLSWGDRLVKVDAKKCVTLQAGYAERCFILRGSFIYALLLHNMV